ncbi:MAG: DUF177 domain-containing protein [Coriobacteriia bacterium]
MENYPVKLTSILDDLGATITVADEFDFDRLEVGSEVFVQSSPAHFDIWLTNGGTSVVSGGSVVAEVVATCSRCLREFPLIIRGAVDGFYIEPGKEDGIPDDQDYELISHEGVVDVLPSLMVALVLEAPFAPVHDEECAGLCASCGADLNEGKCGCADASPDEHPFAALGALLTDERQGDDV